MWFIILKNAINYKYNFNEGENLWIESAAGLCVKKKPNNHWDNLVPQSVWLWF